MNSSAPDESLLAAHNELIQAIRKGDSALVSRYADDIVFMPPNDQSIYGKDEVSDWYREYFAHFTIKGFVETDRHVTMLDDWAILRWCYQIVIHPRAGGDRILDEGRIMLVWNR